MLKKCSFFSENRQKVLFFQWSIAMIHVQIMIPSWEMNTHSSIYGSTKGKTGSKVQKTHFLQHYVHVHRVQASPCTNFVTLLVAPQKSGVPRPIVGIDIEHSETVIVCMSKQILALFQLKKSSKRAIFTKKRNKGRKKGAFPKRAKKGEKRASTFGKGLPQTTESCLYNSLLRSRQSSGRGAVLVLLLLLFEYASYTRIRAIKEHDITGLTQLKKKTKTKI